jgi:hypothetical protein
MKPRVLLYSSTEESFRLRKRLLGLHRNSTKGPASVFENFVCGLVRLKIPFRVVRFVDELLQAEEFDLVLIPVWNKTDEDLFDLFSRIATKRIILGPNIELSAKLLDFLSINSQKYSCVIVPNSSSRLAKMTRWPRIKWKDWPIGVDTQYWSPGKFPRKKDKVVIYKKSIGAELDIVDKKLIDAVLKNEMFRVVSYGSYSPAQFRQILRRSTAAIWFGVSESQGLALAESWSCDVPTWVRVPNSHRDRPDNFAPYLSVTTGDFFVPGNISSLYELLEISSVQWQSSPRDWILNNLTIEDSLSKLLQIAEC